MDYDRSRVRVVPCIHGPAPGVPSARTVAFRCFARFINSSTVDASSSHAVSPPLDVDALH